MKTKIKIFLLILFCNPVFSQSNLSINKADIIKNYNVHSFYFLENKGQWADDILYKTELNGSSCWLLKNALSFGFLAPLDSIQIENNNQIFESNNEQSHLEKEFKHNGGFVWNLEFVNHNTEIKTEQIGIKEGVFHYYIGNDSTKWARNCKKSSAIKYLNVWDNTDFLLYAKDEKDLEYDVILHPGSNIENILFNINGPVSAKIANDKSLEITTPLGIIKKSRPIAYQIIDGIKIDIDVAFKLEGNKLSFIIGTYNHKYDLVIDPLLWSTWVSGKNENSYVYDLAADEMNHVYITGFCNSFTFPSVPGAFNSKYSGNNSDAIISKIKNDGTNLLFTAFFGGNNYENGHRIAYENSFVYIMGQTMSTNLPITTQNFQSKFGNVQDLFFVKLSEDGSNLNFCSYLGGSLNDIPNDLAVNNGIVSMGGYTSSTDFPLSSNAFRSSMIGTNDNFLFVYNINSNSLMFSTFLGGSGNDNISGLSIENNIVYVSGYTVSKDFPITSNAFQSVFNGVSDLFFMKIKLDTPKIIYSSYIGGNSYDKSNSIAVENGNVYICGQTYSKDFPITYNSYDTTYNDIDAFVLKFSKDNKLLYSTYIGTRSRDDAIDIVVENGISTLVGVISSQNKFPFTEFIIDSTLLGRNDVFIVVLNFEGTELLYSTLIGGLESDYFPSIVKNKCNTYVGVTSHSNTFPTTDKAFIKNKPNTFYDAMVILSIKLTNVNSKIKPKKLPNKVKLCKNKSIFLKTGIKSTYWSSGQTDSMIMVDKPGVYHTYIQISCDSIYHDSSIIYLDTTNINPLGNDTIICKKPFSLTLNSGLDSCIWSNQQTSTANTVNESGLYWVKSLEYCSKNYKDSILITLDTSKIDFKLPNDTIICDDDAIKLSTGNDSTLWSSGIKSSSIQVNKAGMIWAELLNQCKEKIRDTVYIYAMQSPNINLPKDTFICGDIHLKLDCGVDSAIWSNGTMGRYLTVTSIGTYSAFRSNYCGRAYDEINIFKDNSPSEMYIPNTFSPNQDGLNELFPMDMIQVDDFKITIFSRWGEKLYESNQAWNGVYKDKLVQEGVYLWQITYLNCKHQKKNHKGTVSIVR